jgi:hypothetical protein
MTDLQRQQEQRVRSKQTRSGKLCMLASTVQTREQESRTHCPPGAAIGDRQPR